MKQLKQRWLPDLVLLGDNSRYVFLNWLCFRGKIPSHEGKAIWARHSTKFTLQYQDDAYYMETPKLLPHMTLCIPPEDDENGLELKKNTWFAVFEGDHFGQERSRMHLDRLAVKKREAVVVLMDLPRLQASTDLLEPGADLSNAQKRYAEQGVATVTIQNDRGICMVLHWHQPLTKTWLRQMKGHLNTLQTRVDDLEFDYELLLQEWKENSNGLLSEEAMDRLCSCQTARRERKDNLWDCFSATAARMIGSSNEMTEAIGLYREILSNPLVFWDVGKDAAHLKKSLEESFQSRLSERERSGHYRNMTKLPAGFKQEDFDRVAAKLDKNGNALIRIFTETIILFFSVEIPTHMIERLTQRCKRLEELMQ